MEIFQQIAAVCLVLGLAILAAYGSRKARAGALFSRIGGTGVSRVCLIQRLPLTPQHSVCIVRVDERELVLGLHAGGIAVLDGKPAPAGKGEK